MKKKCVCICYSCLCTQFSSSTPQNQFFHLSLNNLNSFNKVKQKWQALFLFSSKATINGFHFQQSQNFYNVSLLLSQVLVRFSSASAFLSIITFVNVALITTIAYHSSSVSVPLCLVLFSTKPFIIISFCLEQLFEVRLAIKFPLQGCIISKSIEKKKEKLEYTNNYKDKKQEK